MQAELTRYRVTILPNFLGHEIQVTVTSNRCQDIGQYM